LRRESPRLLSVRIIAYAVASVFASCAKKTQTAALSDFGYVLDYIQMAVKTQTCRNGIESQLIMIERVRSYNREVDLG
jgi:hypothetical protein